MKYFNNLTAIESEIIRMNYLRSMLTVISNAYETSNQEDIENCIWQAKELADGINENLAEEFQNLFDIIREDTMDDDVEFPCYEEPVEEPVYDTQPLQDVMNSWIRKR
jgi:DNA replication initiation complex subunit (GINS family)